ncbi:hypothetical protein GWI33_001508, partial [Rhynchophorus ferrugineus]
GPEEENKLDKQTAPSTTTLRNITPFHVRLNCRPRYVQVFRSTSLPLIRDHKREKYTNVDARERPTLGESDGFFINVKISLEKEFLFVQQ